MKDGYASQIADFTDTVWGERRKTSIEQSFRTLVDFLLGNSMLLRQNNRLSLELADFFTMLLPKEGQGEGIWCLVVALLQGKHCPRSGHDGSIY